VKESNHDRRGAARAHLTILREQRQKHRQHDASIVKLAFGYGVTVSEIAADLEVNEIDVRALLLSGDRVRAVSDDSPLSVRRGPANECGWPQITSALPRTKEYQMAGNMDRTRAALYEQIEKHVKEVDESSASVGTRTAILKDLALAFRFTAGGSQPGSVDVKSS